MIQLIKKEYILDKMFNYIITTYHKTRPDESESLFKSIFSNVKHSTKTYDIIDFYNQVFVVLLGENIHKTLIEEKTPKKRKYSTPGTEAYCLSQRLGFDDDSAYSPSHVVYESLKSINNNASSGSKTPVKSPYGGYGFMTPDLSKTPVLRTESIRSLYSELLVKDESFSLKLKNHSNSSVFQNKIQNTTNNINKSQSTANSGNTFSRSMGTMDIIPEENENAISDVTPKFTPLTLNFSNVELDQNNLKPSQSSELGTPEFKKFI